VDGEPLSDEPGVRRWTVRDVGDQSVALTGVIARELVESHWIADETSLRATAASAAVERALADARTAAGEFDHTVVVSHCGHRDDRTARECEVDVVLGGHVHDRHREWVADTLVARPGARGSHVLAVTLNDADAAGAGLDADGSTAAGLTVRSHASGEESPSRATVETLRSLQSDLGLTRTVTVLDRAIERSREHLYPESRVGNLVADAFRQASGADVALFNVGLLRAGPPLSGTVTVADCRSLAPFDNQIHVTTLTGAELCRPLANCAELSDGLPDDAVHAHVSGVTVEFERDPGAPEPRRLTRASVDPDREHTVATPSFAFHVDGFEPLTPERIEATHAHQHDALETHLRRTTGAVEVEGRITVDRPGQ
jgi:2',3'-cyclic-nucleotide 2'-phosphodiesterase (5'-nucleotidase family)